jgi:putative membrane protein
MSRSMMVPLLAVFLAGNQAIAGAASLSKADTTFLQTAIQTDLGRYAMGSLAEKKATNDSLKTIGKDMAAQSNTDSKTLTKIAKSADVEAPNKPTLTQTYHYSNISGASGKDFDQAFAQAVLIDDQEALDASQQEVQSGTDPQLKAIAKKNIGALQSEIKTVQKFTS